MANRQRPLIRHLHSKVVSVEWGFPYADYIVGVRLLASRLLCVCVAASFSITYLYLYFIFIFCLRLLHHNTYTTDNNDSYGVEN